MSISQEASLTTAFNLLDEPWLPVLYRGEPLPRDVSIREALGRAPDIVKLGNESPLETVALHRLLLAILHRTHPIRSDDDWSALWQTGRFDARALDSYLLEWETRFDLYDPEHPFFQVPALPPELATTIAKLGHQFASGNNSALFDHSVDDRPAGVTSDQAARLLVAQQSFAVGGLITRLKGEPASAVASHLLKAAVVLATGRNLFETLVLNMVRVDGRQDEPFHFDPANDRPAWEQEPPTAALRGVLGYLDLLTFQPRRVRILPPGSDGLVRRAVIMAGWQLPGDRNPADVETMVAYGRNDKAATGQNPRPPVGFRSERALWRDSQALLQQAADHGRPRSLRHIGELASNGDLPRSATVGLAAYGLSSDRAKLFLWREEQYPLPLALLAEDQMLARLWHAVAIAEDARDRLSVAVWRMAEKAMAPAGNGDLQRVRNLANSLEAERVYWPALDLAFRQLVSDLAATYATDLGAAALDSWAQSVREAASAAFAHAARALETSGRGFRAAAEIEPHFQGALRRATNLHLEDSRP